MVQVLKVKRLYTVEQAEKKFKGKFLNDEDCHQVITEDTDAYDLNGNLLFKFRKKVIPIDVLKLGVESFKNSIELTEGRGLASGSSHKRIRKDGSISKITVGNKVWSGLAGYSDPAGMIPYCRKTGFTRKYFDEFTAGIPFVKTVDNLYKELVPEKYAIQKQFAEGTNRNFVIADTSFTSVTINRNFRTAIHRDSGDLEAGFGNLIAYREGAWTGCYFTLPEYGVGVDMQNGDILFVNVHLLHGNSSFENWDEETCLRVSFVMYYREFMIKCSSPEEELFNTKMRENGFYRL